VPDGVRAEVRLDVFGRVLGPPYVLSSSTAVVHFGPAGALDEPWASGGITFPPVVPADLGTPAATGPWGQPVSWRAELAFPSCNRILRSGTTPNAEGVDEGVIASYDLTTGALDTTFASFGFSDIGPTDPWLLVDAGFGCERFFVVDARYEDGPDGGYRIGRFWGPVNPD
jgi:hypothetical protein